MPAAPALKDMGVNAEYRDALMHADLAITDSAYMVLIWNLVSHHRIGRLSGLEYLRTLLEEAEMRRPGGVLWVMASEGSAATNLGWLGEQGIVVPAECVYVAPRYGAVMEDEVLVEQMERLRPRHIIITLGGGTQERLGIYLKRRLGYRPAIHCIGAAIAFLSGDQVRIPMWADRFYLGWLFRCVSNPEYFLPRYWEARKLFALVMRYRSELPPLGVQGKSMTATL